TLGGDFFAGRTDLVIALVDILFADFDSHPPPDPLNHLRRYLARRFPRFFGLGYRRRPPEYFAFWRACRWNKLAGLGVSPIVACALEHIIRINLLKRILGTDRRLPCPDPFFGRHPARTRRPAPNACRRRLTRGTPN